jgi:hypothetical protein
MFPSANRQRHRHPFLIEYHSNKYLQRANDLLLQIRLVFHHYHHHQQLNNPRLLQQQEESK